MHILYCSNFTRCPVVVGELVRRRKKERGLSLSAVTKAWDYIKNVKRGKEDGRRERETGIDGFLVLLGWYSWFVFPFKKPPAVGWYRNWSF